MRSYRRHFLRGYRKLDDFEAQSKFGTWIYGIAMNCALDILNKQKRQTLVPIADEYDDELPTVQVADHGAGPDRLLLSQEIEARRHAAMERLTPTERVAFVMRHVEERSTEEIAATLAYTDPDRLVWIHDVMTRGDKSGWSACMEDFLPWQTRARSFAQLAAFTGDHFALTGDGLAEELAGPPSPKKLGR